MKRLLVVLVVVGCGRVSSEVDAAGGDGPTDGDNRSIQITVLGDDLQGTRGQPIPDVDVFFIAPDDTYVKTTTSALGVATAMAPAGSTALVSRLIDTNRFALTAVMALNPGDHIEVGQATPAFNNSLLGMVSVSFPAVANAASYTLYAPCGSGDFGSSTTLNFYVYGGCDASNVTLVAEAFDANNNTIAYGSKANFNLMAALNGSTTIQSMNGGFTNITAQFTNIPVGFANASWSQSYLGDAVSYGYVYRNQQLTGQTTVSFQATLPSLGGTTYADATLGPSGTYLPVMFHHQVDSLSPAFQVDVASGILKLVSVPTFDAPTQTITWTNAPNATGADPELMVMRGAYNIQNQTQSVAFTVIGPVPQAPTAKLPKFPTEIANLQPKTGDSGYVNQMELAHVAGKTYSDLAPTADRTMFNLMLRDEGSLGDYWVTGFVGK